MKRLLLMIGVSLAAFGGVASMAAAAHAPKCPQAGYVCIWRTSTPVNQGRPPDAPPARVLVCARGTYYLGQDYVSPIAEVWNGCPTRVWLHNHTDGSGRAVCLSPNGSDGITEFFFVNWELRHAGNLLISANPHLCYPV
jgi:hypothetical protein